MHSLDCKPPRRSAPLVPRRPEQSGLGRPATRGFGPLISTRTGDPVEIVDDESPLPLTVANTGAMAVVGAFMLPLTLPLQVLVGLAWIAVWGLLPFLISDWRRQRRITRARRTRHIRATPEGTLVRLVGTIESKGDPFFAIASRRPAVYARTTFFARRDQVAIEVAACEDVRGMPFYLRLEDDTIVAIDPSTVRLFDRASNVKGLEKSDRHALAEALQLLSLDRTEPIRQSVLAPGDTVEVAGRLIRAVDPLAEAAPARGVPVGFTIAPGEDGHVWVRRVRSPHRALPTL
jgi:hypothetical protein